MRACFYILPLLPLLLLASNAEAASRASVPAGGTLPDIEVNLDVLGGYPAAPSATPVPAQQPVAAKQIHTAPAAAPVAATPVAPAPAPAPVSVQAPALVPFSASPETAANISTPATPAAPLPAATGAEQPMSGYVQAGGDYHTLSNGFGTWAGEYLKGEVQTDAKNRWGAQTIHQREFGSSGQYFSGSNTHEIDDDWYSTVAVGGGSADATFFPKYRVDAFLNRKWLDGKNLITTVGLGADHARDYHRDESVYFGATYYFPAPWVIQGGVRYNNSSPGGVRSVGSNFGITEGTNKDHFISLSYSFGKEAYQIVSGGSALSSFNSQTVGLDLRKWLDDDWGFDVSGEHYHSPNYDREGVNFGVFKEF